MIPVAPIDNKNYRSTVQAAVAVIASGIFFWLAPGALAGQPVEYTVKGKPVSKQTYEAVMLVNDALPLINSGHVSDAITKLSRALELSPNLPEAHYNLAVCYSKQGHPAQAQAHYQAVVEQKYDMPTAWLSLAGLYQNSGNLEKAAAVYKDALATFPPETWTRYPELHYNYGLALGKLGQTDQAIDQLKQSLPGASKYSGLWLSLGALYQSNGQLAESIAAYKEFLSRFPKDAEAPRLRGTVAIMEKELVRAKHTARTLADTSLLSDDYYNEISGQGIHRWPTSLMPLSVYVESGEGVKGFKPFYDELLKQCFHDWQEAAGGKLTFQFVPDPSKAVIQCKWSSDPSSVSNRAEGGEAKVLVRSDGSLAHASVTILTVPVTPLRPMTDNLMRYVCLHEIGHAFGIVGHSTRPGDVMFFSSTLSDEHKDLSRRDANTISRLYRGD